MDMFEHKFEEELKQEAPLAARMRPHEFHDFVGQEHLVGKGRVLRKAIEAGQLPSIILWGPPGSGKTTLAYIIAAANPGGTVPFGDLPAAAGEGSQGVVVHAAGKTGRNVAQS